MGFFGIIGVLVIVYYLAQILFWTLLDCDVELYIKDKLGKPISSLRGKVVWITGASSGIGKYLALLLAQHGVKLVLSARNVEELEKIKRDCIVISNGALKGDDILVLNMDMTKIDEHRTHFNQVIQQFKSLDVLVNNAGRSQRAEWADIDISVDREIFELDVFSVLHLSRIALNYFKSNSIRGHIAVTSSSAGLIGAPMSGSYTGAKHAIHGYFETLRNEGAPVDITLFCPGPTVTNFLQEAFTGNPGEKFGQSVQPDDKRMTSERCAYLYGIALANKTQLSWVGVFPISLIMYIGCYYPNVKRVLLKMVGLRRLSKVRDSR